MRKAPRWWTFVTLVAGNRRSPHEDDLVLFRMTSPSRAGFSVARLSSSPSCALSSCSPASPHCPFFSTSRRAPRRTRVWWRWRVCAPRDNGAWLGRGGGGGGGRTRRAPHVPVHAGHPSRSKRAQSRATTRRAPNKMPVMEKLAMWGIDVDRMRSGRKTTERAPTSSRLGEDGGGGSSGGIMGSGRMMEGADDVERTDDGSALGAVVASPESADLSPAVAPGERAAAAAKVVEMRARQEAERWPAQGTDEWLLARCRIVSASEASSALGLDRFRSPERLIRDKLARLDALEAISPELLAAVAAEAAEAVPTGAANLGWRVNKKGRRGRKKPKRMKGGGVGGVRVRATTRVEGIQRLPPAVVHGNAFEPVARAHYAAVEAETVHDFGLKLHDELGWLGASPDGVTVSGRLLEIKCPYSRPVLPTTRAKEHYPQLQVLMEVFDLDECHFVQFKPPGTGPGHAGVMNEDRPLYLRETVKRDAGWWRANQPRLLAFHRRLEAAIEERAERIARHLDAGVAVDAEEEGPGNPFQEEANDAA